MRLCEDCRWKLEKLQMDFAFLMDAYDLLALRKHQDSSILARRKEAGIMQPGQLKLT